MITVERKVRFGQARGRRKKVQEGSGNCVTSTGRIPRVARLMALAIRFDQLIRDGVVADQAELARVGHVSRARLTQIMNLLNLAPDIQEDLLFLAVTERGRRHHGKAAEADCGNYKLAEATSDVAGFVISLTPTPH